MKKVGSVILILIMILLIAAIGVGGWYVFNKDKESNEKISQLQNQIDSIKNEDNSKENKIVNENNVVKNNDTKTQNTTTQNNVTGNTTNTNVSKNNESTLNWQGSYSIMQDGTPYLRSDLKIKNQTSNSIDFEINTAHGADADHVNIGEVKGNAKKVEVPSDMKFEGVSAQEAYEFKEVIDGKTNVITIVFTAHKQFKYVNIKENYEGGMNPYAGHNVSFEGEYEFKAE